MSDCGRSVRLDLFGSARPRLVPHNAVVGDISGEYRPLRQQIELVGGVRLELAIILNNRQ